MVNRVLITGGAGFIGSHLADELLSQDYLVRVLDNLSPQIHGPAQQRPEYLAEDVELIQSDVRDPQAVRRALQNVDAVFHFAAMVGVGQSMYQVADYTAVNQMGTAVLLEALIERPVSRLVVASSMSIYGEGRYVDSQGRVYDDAERDIQRVARGDWGVYSLDEQLLEPVPTPEEKAPRLASVYALSKYDQERMCLIVGQAYKVPTVALRFFNVYGPRQALSNPYTGVLAIFASRLLNGRAPVIFEDGEQRRDFVSVYDVARACRLALEAPAAAGEVFNVGSGHHCTIRELAERLMAVTGTEYVGLKINGEHRLGDIRHCFADTSRIQRALGYEAGVSLEEGIAGLASWLEGKVAEDRVDQAHAELAARGLTL